MSSRSRFLLAATAVMLLVYNTDFPFFPLYDKQIVYDVNKSEVFYVRDKVPWCKGLRLLDPPLPKPIALVSFPGSGNSWLRYLLQQATGIITGSIYHDRELLANLGLMDISNSSALVIKVHEYLSPDSQQFSSAILLIRNPRDALLSEYNRRINGHTGLAPRSYFRDIEWEHYVTETLEDWEKLHHSYLRKFPGPIHLVFYKALVNNTRLILEGILSFLNYTITEEDMKCALLNKDKSLRRNKRFQNFDPFTEDMYRQIDIVKQRVNKEILNYIKKIKNKEVYQSNSSIFTSPMDILAERHGAADRVGYWTYFSGSTISA